MFRVGRVHTTRFRFSSITTRAATMNKITFGENIPGYFYSPEGAKNAGVIVIQEWWGINDEILAQAKYIADNGKFHVLVPDLYKGKSSLVKEEAHHNMSNLDFPQALKEVAAAADYLRAQGCAKVGVTGFCMGGAITFGAACHAKVDAIAPFYGFNPAICNLAEVNVPVLAQFGDADQFKGFSDAETAKKIETELKAHGKNAEVIIYPGADHGFLNGITPVAQTLRGAMNFVPTPEGVQDKAWSALLGFFEKNLN